MVDNKKLNVAVVFEGELNVGGGFQTQLSTRLSLIKEERYNFIAVVFSLQNKTLLEKHGIKAIFLKINLLQKICRQIFRSNIFSKFNRHLKLKTFFEKRLDGEKIDLVYFLSPSALALDLVTHNYIFTIWDLSHRDTPEFPEVNHWREFESREILYNNAPKKAIAVLTDSELGKSNAIRRYGLDKERVFSASFAPSVNVKSNIYIDVKNKYKIDGDYIYYPAQFWSHKNHIYILDALAILKKQDIKISVIFSGSDKGNLQYVLNYAKNIGIEELVKYIGFAPNEEIYHLYKQSFALVMPSYFGPTNIPPLEAFSIGTPVFYSDLDGLREQVGDAAVLCDLNNPEDLANKLIIMSDTSKRIEMIEKGFKRLDFLQKNSVEKILVNIFDSYAIKRKCWL